MRHSFWGYLLIVMGIAFVIIMLLLQRITTTSEEDFYLGREVLEASMIDAVDYGTYRTTGKLVMSEQKFVEVFMRRFAETVTNNKTYELSFYDIYEEPPKASVKIKTNSGETNINSTEFDVDLNLLMTGILETIYDKNTVNGVSKETNKANSKTATLYNKCNNIYVYRENKGKSEIKGGEAVSLTYARPDNNMSDEELIKASCNIQLNGVNDYCKVRIKGTPYYIRYNDLSTNEQNCNNVTVSYIQKGGIGCEEKSVTQRDSTWGKLCIPTRNGYSFDGWYTDSNYKTRVTNESKANDNIQVVAKWILKTDNKLTYNLNGGVSNSSECSTGKTGKTGSAWGTLACVPTIDGKAFSGWFTSLSGGREVNSNTFIEGDIVVYARWSDSSIKINYNNNGGKGCTYQYASLGSKWGAFCLPVRGGYSFEGWYAGDKKISETDIAKSSLDVVAHWKALENCSKSNYSGCTTTSVCKPKVKIYMSYPFTFFNIGSVEQNTKLYILEDQGEFIKVSLGSEKISKFGNKSEGYIRKVCLTSYSNSCTGCTD